MRRWEFGLRDVCYSLISTFFCPWFAALLCLMVVTTEWVDELE